MQLRESNKTIQDGVCADEGYNVFKETESDAAGQRGPSGATGWQSKGRNL